MKIPNSYAEWTECLEIIKEGTKDSDVLECIRESKIELTAGVAGRFAAKLSETIQYRIKKAYERFQKTQQNSKGDINIFLNSLLLLRKEFKFLIKLVEIDGLSEAEKGLLVDALKTEANSLQNSMENDATKKDRTGTLTSLLKRNKVNNLEEL